MNHAKYLCEQINLSLCSLSYSFSEDSHEQKLIVNSYKPVYFPVKLGKNSHETSQWMRHTHSGGAIYEPGTIAVFEALYTSAKSLNTVFDVGALYGYFSLICLSIFDTAKVYSFEMNPVSFASLKHNIDINHQLDVISRNKAFNYALSDSSELNKSIINRGSKIDSVSNYPYLDRLNIIFKNMQVYGTYKLWESKDKLKQFLDGTPKKKYFKQYFNQFNIDCWSIDDFCEKNYVMPDLIKMDVEGFQAKIIPGAMKTLEKSKPFFLLEFDSLSKVNAFGLSNKEIVKPLFDMGYQLIWGNHRTQNSAFIPLNYNDLDSSHECNSLGLFFVEERLRLN
ncbi:FkbM family methyltransferase [Coleofasciculus sp.]|uniref:FkbM family methyltransferase n=1 Tax=Coleofasciculus sp. TaxID=3100458 RepID=UPI0039F93B00